MREGTFCEWCFSDCLYPVFYVRHKTCYILLYLSAVTIFKQTVITFRIATVLMISKYLQNYYTTFLHFQISMSMLQLEFAPQGGMSWSNPIDKRLCVPVKSKYHLHIFYMPYNNLDSVTYV